MGTSNNDNSQKLFVGTMLGMSWQMAIAVLLPTVAGYKLDDHFHSAPKLTLIGLLLAVVASVLIVRNALRNLNTYMMLPESKPELTTKDTPTKK